MATVDITTQAYGTTASVDSGCGTDELTIVRGEVDIAEAIANSTTYTAGDTLRFTVAVLEEGTHLHVTDFVITEALVTGGNGVVNCGHTAADPDEYVDGQTNTAVGRFTSYVSVTYPELMAQDNTIYIQVAGDGLVSGKIAFKLIADVPAKGVRERGKKKDYTNS